MARKLRLEYEGALYHVINRGNYRADVFASPQAAAAFERCLFEAADRSGWRLHAFAIMRNHYHLALETPRGNLVAGMHWLQGTFATRFNRLRGERGHLFQGRYQAILIEPGEALVRVADYIHLNPVRAGIVPAEAAADFRWGSLRRFVRGPRPEGLVCGEWLATLGLRDEVAGWQTYVGHLQKKSTAPGAGDPAERDVLARGWAIGTPAWREATAKEHAAKQTLRRDGLTGAATRALRETQWQEALETGLRNAGRTREEARDDWKGADWKIRLAWELRQRTSATNSWIATNLQMGAPSSVSQYLHRARSKL